MVSVTLCFRLEVAVECFRSSPRWSTILACLFSGQALQSNNRKPLAEHSEPIHVHVNPIIPRLIQSHLTRRATNVTVLVYYCSVIGFSAAYCCGAACDDAIDRWLGQIAAYNVDGIRKFQLSLVRFWLKICVRCCGEKATRWSSQVGLKDTQHACCCISGKLCKF